MQLKDNSQRGGGGSRLRALADLKRTAPEFGGETSEYQLFKQALKGFLARHQRDIDDNIALDVAINACTGAASRYLGSLPFAPHTLEEYWAALDSRFGQDLSTRVQRWQMIR